MSGKCGAAAALLCALLLATPARGDVTGYVELTATDFETRTQDDAGQTTTTNNDSYFQLFNVVLDRRLWPNLRMRTGGFFERRSGTFSAGENETDSTTTRLRPFFNLTLRTRLQVAELGYERSENRQRQGGSSASSDLREVWYANLAYTPDRRPQLRLDYFGTSSSQGAGLASDLREDRFQLSSDYRWRQNFRASYRGTLLETSDRLDGSEIRDVSHATRLSYSDNFLEGRVRLGADYRLTHRALKTITSVSGEFRFPLLRLSGGSSIDDTPEMDLLDPNPGLVDGNRTAGAGVNLGLPAPGADDRPRNLGLDLASATELDSLLVWVDRDLPAEIAGTFAWEVWVSDDNENWRLHARVMPALFGPFLQRFQVDFNNVVTRYVKLVVAPLGPAVPFAADYASIVVTELEAELRRTPEDVRDTGHLATFDLRTRLANVPAVYHELTFFLNAADSLPTTYTLSNGLSLNHRFKKIYAVAARVANEDRRERVGSSEALLYSASLSASAIRTLEHRLVFSGRNESGIDNARDTRSAFMFNSARLYRGVDLNLGIGTSSSTIEMGRSVDSDEWNATATVVPHRTTTINLSYRDRTDEISDPSRPDLTEQIARAAEMSIAHNALETLYLYGSYRIERRTGLARRTYGNYSVNWSPFRDGTLQLSLRFNETLRSEDDAVERVLGSNVRWNVSRRSYVDVSFQKLTTDSNLQRVDTEVLSCSLRFAF